MNMLFKAKTEPQRNGTDRQKIANKLDEKHTIDRLWLMEKLKEVS